jgi:hypothetical protein
VVTAKNRQICGHLEVMFVGFKCAQSQTLGKLKVAQTANVPKHVVFGSCNVLLDQIMGFCLMHWSSLCSKWPFRHELWWVSVDRHFRLLKNFLQANVSNDPFGKKESI